MYYHSLSSMTSFNKEVSGRWDILLIISPTYNSSLEWGWDSVWIYFFSTTLQQAKESLRIS